MLRAIALVLPFLLLQLVPFGCVSPPPESIDDGPRPLLLIAPMNARGVAEPARTRADSVAIEIRRYLRARGFDVESLAFADYRALQRDPTAYTAPYHGLVVPRVKSKTIVTKKWNGVSWSIPKRGMSGHYTDRFRAAVSVLVLEVEVMDYAGERTFSGIGGLDHLERLVVDLEQSKFWMESWPDTLTKPKRIKKAVSLALKAYDGS